MDNVRKDLKIMKHLKKMINSNQIKKLVISEQIDL